MPNSPALEATPNQSLYLNDKSGKGIKLTASHLEQWFSYAESDLSENTLNHDSSNASDLSTRFLKHFGLQAGFQTPLDIINFLESPGGKILTALIDRQLAEMEAIDENAKQQFITEQLIKMRRLSFLLAGLLHEHEAQEHYIQREEQQLARDNRRRAEESASIQKRLAPANSRLDASESLSYSADAYAKSAEIIEHLLDNILVESSAVDDAIAENERLTELAAKKYKQYNEQLDIAYIEIATWANSPSFPIETAKQKIAQLTAEINEDADKISELLEKDRGDDNEVHEKMYLSNARNLHIATLIDMISLAEGKKSLYTKDGMETPHLHNAEFIVPKQKKLVCINNTYFLMDAEKNPKNLSHAEKTAAENAYLRLKPELLCVKPLIQHNQAMEQENHSKVKSVLVARSQLMQDEVTLLANQLMQLRFSRADIQASMQSTTPAPSMRPAPTPTSTVKNINKSGSSMGSYSHMLASMQPTTPAEIKWLKENTKKAGSPELVAQVNKLTPGQPIPPQTIKNLLANRYLGTLWLNPQKADIAKTDLTPYGAAPSKTTPFPITPKRPPSII